jgi:RimJ/RimL family protein N-acetyltransferase
MKNNLKIYSLTKIETSRLIIRPVRLGDEVPIYQSITNSIEVLRKWQAWAQNPSMDATREFVQRGVFAWESGMIADFPMVMLHKQDQKIIGAVGYNDRCNLSEGLYEIGYWCDIDYQGQGLVTECANALAHYAFEALQAKDVVISMQTQNKKSKAVAERLNFNKIGIKERDPMDCVSDKPEKNYIFSVNNKKILPPLEVYWTHEEHGGNDAAIISWAREVIGITDEKAFSQSKAIVKTAWSNVLEISTSNHSVYLKQTPPDLFLEADVIQNCRELCQITEIPEVIARNKNLHCFLMRKCGDKTLRTVFDGKLNVDLLLQGLHVYRRMQKTTALHVDAFLQVGVPDWRLQHFPKLYQDLISNKKFLKAHGLEAAQIKLLQNQLYKVQALCQELSNYGIPECLNHSDFHENNMLFCAATQKVRIIDLGESAINHPLFSLVAFLKIPCENYKVALTSIDYQKLYEVCFNGWLEDKKDLRRVIEIINLLLPIYLLFAQKRFLDSINLPYNADNPMSVKQHDKINKGFIWFIENMKSEL